MNNQQKRFNERYYNVQQAASVLGIHPESLRRLCRLGKIEFVQVNRNYILFEREYMKQYAETYDKRQGNTHERFLARHKDNSGLRFINICSSAGGSAGGSSAR